MLAPPAKTPMPGDVPAELRWIVEHIALEHPIPIGAPMRNAALIGVGQSADETFIRASRGGMAFERGRWDFVAAGASSDGSDAWPLLRWPSTADVLQAWASASGRSVALSDQGRRTQTASRLYESATTLANDLYGIPRKLLDAFLVDGGPDGPYGHRGHTTFRTLHAVCGAEWDSARLRAWLDERLARNVIRRGLLLRCESCWTLAFYAIKAVGQGFGCSQCGDSNQLTQPRWNQPATEPEWFYALNPLIEDLLNRHADIPLLAWRQQALAGGARLPWFEFNIIGPDGKPEVEFDFVSVHDGELAVGEAKLSGDLDGSSQVARRRDARKMLDGARLLNASELCLASGTVWSARSRNVIAEESRVDDYRHIRISFLENLAGSAV
jgi:hypothetical protein